MLSPRRECTGVQPGRVWVRVAGAEPDMRGRPSLVVALLLALVFRARGPEDHGGPRRDGELPRCAVELRGLHPPIGRERMNRMDLWLGPDQLCCRERLFH